MVRLRKLNDRCKMRLRRKLRGRKKISGTRNCPRLSIYKSHLHLYAQLIDDEEGKTLLAVCTLQDGVKANRTSVKAAEEIGRVLAEKAIQRDIKKIVFDKSGYAYAGRVRALADAARAVGLIF